MDLFIEHRKNMNNYRKYYLHLNIKNDLIKNLNS